jgi:cyclase
LVIELDGSIHQTPEIINNDKLRQLGIESLGIKVLRFKNQEVYNDIRKVLNTIKANMEVPPGGFRGHLAKRIIPCLDVKDGRTVKGINFIDLRDAGDPVELAWQYSRQGADELVFLDITATHEKRKTTIEMVKSIARQINIPFTIGGGISELKDAEALLNAGADKISINSAAVRRPELINELANAFGVQFVVLAVDTKHLPHGDFVHLNGGRIATELQTQHWIKEAEERGAGEILLTSMDKDGTKSGFDHILLKEINDRISVPVIASGGAGSAQDFIDVFQKSDVDAALAASVFHYGEILIPELKQLLKNNQIEIRI